MKNFLNQTFAKSKHTFVAILLGFLILIAVFPFAVSAQTFVIPCDGPERVNGTFKDCGFGDFMQLISNVLNFLIILSIPMATIAFTWAGFLILTSAGNSSKIEQGKEIFWKVLIGFIFVLSAWLIVRLITTTLLNDSNYVDLLDTASSYEMHEYPPGLHETVFVTRHVA